MFSEDLDIPIQAFATKFEKLRGVVDTLEPQTQYKIQQARSEAQGTIAPILNKFIALENRHGSLDVRNRDLEIANTERTRQMGAWTSRVGEAEGFLRELVRTAPMTTQAMHTFQERLS